NSLLPGNFEAGDGSARTQQRSTGPPYRDGLFKGRENLGFETCRNRSSALIDTRSPQDWRSCKRRYCVADIVCAIAWRPLDPSRTRSTTHSLKTAASDRPTLTVHRRLAPPLPTAASGTVDCSPRVHGPCLSLRPVS